MGRLPFVLWMLGWPLVSEGTNYLGWPQGSRWEPGITDDAAMFSICVWAFIGAALWLSENK